jgi:hypothetical protein
VASFGGKLDGKKVSLDFPRTALIAKAGKTKFECKLLISEQDHGKKIASNPLTELFHGTGPRIPRIDTAATFNAAARESTGVQGRLL